MFETFKTIVGILFEKEPEKPKIVISLDELCQIWLPYNNSFQPAPASPAPGKDDTVPEKPVPDGQNEKVPIEETGESLSGPETGRKLIELNKFYDEIIEPYRDTFRSHGALEGVNRVVEMLNVFGDCPSIITEGFDSEAGETAPIREALLKVNLRDHTFRVTKNAVKLTRETYHGGSGMMPLSIIAALCHDMGKIPQLREGQGAGYCKDDHPITSVHLFEKIFQEELDTHLLNMVRTAIRDHHLPTTDQFTLLLKEADGKARASEIAESSKNRALEWAGWFNSENLLALIKPYVNTIQTGNFLKAFSVNGTVYCDPSFVYEMTGKMAMDKEVIDITLVRESEKEIALRKIIESLRESNVLSAELGKGYILRRYEVQLERSKKNMSFIPINLGAFDKPEEIEEVKKTYLPIIKGVKPL